MLLLKGSNLICEAICLIHAPQRTCRQQQHHKKHYAYPAKHLMGLISGAKVRKKIDTRKREGDFFRSEGVKEWRRGAHKPYTSRDTGYDRSAVS